MIVTVSLQIENGEVMIVIKIQHGGYSGQFWFDRNGRYVAAAEIFNPS